MTAPTACSDCSPCDDAGAAVGLANCVVHATTWSRQPKCYLEDLFVSPAARGGDLGRALLKAVKQAATDRGAPDVYWHTQQYNGRARSLYDVVGRPDVFRRLRDVTAGPASTDPPERSLSQRTSTVLFRADERAVRQGIRA